MSRQLGWGLAVFGVTAALLVFALVTNVSDGTQFLNDDVRLWLTLGALAGLPVYYLVWGRCDIVQGKNRWPDQLFLIGICGFLVFLNPNMFSVQAIMFPLIWTAASTTRAAIERSVLAAVVVGVAGIIGRNDPSWTPTGLTIMASSLAFTIIMGLWISNIASYGEERARLLEELTRKQGEIAALNRDTGALEERARLSRDLHDTVAQSLTGVVLLARRAGNQVERSEHSIGTELLETLRLIESSASEALQETRDMVATTSTPSLTQSSLSDALARLCDRFGLETGISVDLSLDEDALGSLRREHEVVLLRCVQEGLSNVRKHAEATHVRVGLEHESSGAAVLTVADDGRGVEHPSSKKSGGQFGLDGMNDRLVLVGGSVRLLSSGEGGAVLTVTLPIQGNQEGASE